MAPTDAQINAQIQVVEARLEGIARGRAVLNPSDDILYDLAYIDLVGDRPPGGRPASTVTKLELALAATDAFQRANATLAGANNWLAASDGSMAVSSDEAIGTASAIKGNFRSETYAADQYSSVTLGSVHGTAASFCGPIVRAAVGGAQYAGIYFISGGTPTLALYYRASGTGTLGTLIASLTLTGPLAGGSVLTLVAKGHQLLLMLNGVGIMSAIDANLSSGAPGMTTFNAVTVSEWDGGAATMDALPAATVSDNFNRADGNMSAGQAGWTSLAGLTITGTSTLDPVIASNQIVTASGNHHAAVRNDISGPDQYAGVEQGLTALAAASGGFVGLIVRSDGATNCYFGVCFANTDSSNGVGQDQYSMTYRIYKMVNGTSVWLGACTTGNNGGSGASPFDPTATGYRLVAQGNRISWRVIPPAGGDGLEVLAVTDSAYATGKPGVIFYPPSTEDNFIAGLL